MRRRQAMADRRKDGGFSLIEVLVAAALALFMVAAGAALGASALRADLKAGLVSAATDALLATAERLKSLPLESGELADGGHEENVVSAESRHRLRLSWTVEDAAPGLKKVSLEALPEARAGAGVGLTLYISRQMGFEP